MWQNLWILFRKMGSPEAQRTRKGGGTEGGTMATGVTGTTPEVGAATGTLPGSTKMRITHPQSSLAASESLRRTPGGAIMILKRRSATGLGQEIATDLAVVTAGSATESPVKGSLTGTLLPGRGVTTTSGSLPQRSFSCIHFLSVTVGSLCSKAYGTSKYPYYSISMQPNNFMTSCARLVKKVIVPVISWNGSQEIVHVKPSSS